MSESQEEMTTVVEGLVDAISELVLTSITASFGDVQRICENIANRTNRLVNVAQEVAMATSDSESASNIANGINGIATSVESLVVTFNDLLTIHLTRQNKENLPNAQQSFAKAAKEVGEAINHLVQTVDQSVQRRVAEVVRESIAATRKVQVASRQEPSFLLVAAQEAIAKMQTLVSVANAASASSTNVQRRVKFSEGTEGVQNRTLSLIQAAKKCCEFPNDSSLNAEVEAQVKFLSQSYALLVEAAKMTSTYYSKAAETYEYVKKLIEAAKTLEGTFAELYQTTKSGSNEEFVEKAKVAAGRAMNVVDQALNAAQLEQDPVKKQLILNSVVELREASSAFLKAAKALRSDPNSLEAQRELEGAQRRMDAAIKGVVDVSSTDVSALPSETKFNYAANAIESCANILLRNAVSQYPEATQNGVDLKNIAEAFYNHAQQVAEEKNDPAQKKAILQSARQVLDLANQMNDAVPAVLEDPDNVTARSKLQNGHNSILAAVQQTKENAQSYAGAEGTDVSSLEFDLGKSPEAQVVSASKAEAEAALQLADEAENMLAGISDPQKRKALQEAIQEVRNWAGKVQKAAEELSSNPLDPQLQSKLSEAQIQLGKSIQNVLKRAEEGDENPQDEQVVQAMAQLKMDEGSVDHVAKQGRFLEEAEELLKVIAATFGGNKLSPQETIANAKKLSDTANQLAANLREIAAKVNDPVLKEKLLQSAKIIKDGGIQLKILSAVRAAGSDDKSGTVGNAVKGLQTNIAEVVNQIQADSLKQKFRGIVQSTMNINRVVKAWKMKK